MRLSFSKYSVTYSTITNRIWLQMYAIIYYLRLVFPFASVHGIRLNVPLYFAVYSLETIEEIPKLLLPIAKTHYSSVIFEFQLCDRIWNWNSSLFFNFNSFGSSNNVCTKLLNLFIESQKQFDQCAMKHGAPVKMCQECVQPYVSVIQTFHDLSNTSDPHLVRHKCVDQVINQNTLNIVWSQYQSSRNLWNEAACTSKNKSFMYLLWNDGF